VCVQISRLFLTGFVPARALYLNASSQTSRYVDFLWKLTEGSALNPVLSFVLIAFCFTFSPVQLTTNSAY